MRRGDRASTALVLLRAGTTASGSSMLDALAAGGWTVVLLESGAPLAPALHRRTL